MKNRKRKKIGVSERSLDRQPTVNSRQRRETEERGGLVAQREIDAKFLWKQVEDVVVPRLRLSVIDHVVYMHLLRHSHMEGKRRLRFSIPWLAQNINLSTCPTRDAVRRLAACGVLRLVERSKQGHVAEVRLPEEVRGVRVQARAAARAREAARVDRSDIEQVDFVRTIELRRTIHARERGRCFYCLRRIPSRLECLDHVVPRVRVGCNSYRNLVSACMECNAQKGEQPAEEFLRWLFREHRLGAAELRGRFEALELLAGREAQADASEWGGARIIAFVEARLLGLSLEGSASFFHFLGVRQLCCRSLGPVEGVAI
jgi:5-methylcytosine-specific restriction endonuclease McrA